MTSATGNGATAAGSPDSVDPLAPAEDVDEAEAIYREFTVMVVLNAHVAAELLGLQLLDVEAMNLIAISGPMSAGELAERVGVATATATRVIDRLEEAGYLRRERDANDRRRVILHPVIENLERIAETFQPAQVRLNAVRDRTDPADIATFIRVLAEVRSALREATVEMRTTRRDRRG